MTTSNFAEIFGGGGAAAASVPEGVYDVRVLDARVGKAESRTIFIDLEVLNGPAAGKMTQVNLYVPEVTNRGAVFHYQRKTNAFVGPEFTATLTALGEAPTLDELLDAIARFLIGKTASAELSIQKGGQYDGQNQLDRTSPLTGAPSPTPVVSAAEPAPATEVAPAAVEATPQQRVPF